MAMEPHLLGHLQTVNQIILVGNNKIFDSTAPQDTAYPHYQVLRL